MVLSQIGTRGTIAANYYHVYALTDSIAMTGLVGAGQAVALLLLSPLGGALADRYDRRRLLQLAQAAALAVATMLTVVTLTGVVQAWHVVVSVLLTTAAATFDQPARQALIPALVRRDQIGEAIALLNPSREVAILLGPLLAGVLITLGGPGLMYLVDALTYAALIVVLAFVRVARLTPTGAAAGPVFASIAEGARYVVHRPLITSLMGLDLVRDGVQRLPRAAAGHRGRRARGWGPPGYGLLSSAPSRGRAPGDVHDLPGGEGLRRQGKALLGGHRLLYGGGRCCWPGRPRVCLRRRSPCCSARSTPWPRPSGTPPSRSTPLTRSRGRVTAFYQMSSRGGPAVGDAVVGAIAGPVGPVVALSAGAAGPVLVALAFAVRPDVVRGYQGVVADDGPPVRPFLRTPAAPRGRRASTTRTTRPTPAALVPSAPSVRGPAGRTPRRARAAVAWGSVRTSCRNHPVGSSRPRPRSRASS